MLHPQQLEEYRHMTPGQRIALSLEMTAWNWKQMFVGPEELVSKRFELLNRENDLRNENMLRAIARSRDSRAQR